MSTGMLLRLRHAATIRHASILSRTSTRPSNRSSVTTIRSLSSLYRRRNLSSLQASLLLEKHNLSRHHPACLGLAEWIYQVNVPKGFENFDPQNAGRSKKKPKSGKSFGEKEGREQGKENGSGTKRKTPNEGANKSKKNNQSLFGSFGQQQGGRSGNSSSNGDQPPLPGLMTSFVMLLIVYGMLKLEDDNSDARHSELGTQEITFNEFRNHLLESGDVEKIIVTNKNTTARVFLKPGAKGVPLHSTRSRRLNQQPIGSTSANHDEKDASSGDEFDDETVIEIGTNNHQSRSSVATSRSQAGPHLHHHRLVYRFAIGSVESFEQKLENAQREIGIDPHDFIPVQYASDSTIATELLGIVPSVLLMSVMFAMMRGAAGAGAGGRGGMGGIFQFGKSNAKKIDKNDISVTFKDVAGCQEAKKEIMEFVDFLQDSTRFTKLGAKIPKGALLCGPPGTGKTLLAKAVAGEAGVPFFSISGSDFIEMFVGVGPSRVRDLFKEARANSPCIVFIDEIDAVGRKRGRGGFSGGNDERENTLNQLLVEMDGFQPTEGVVVLAGTNRVDILDEALTRAGRFDRQITVDKPDLLGRKEIFHVHLKGLTLEGVPDDVAGRLAGLTPGFAGADIANICNEAAIVAARRKAEAVAIEDFEKATDRIIGGLESNRIMTDEEKSIVAHHEAGHAVAGWFLEHADPLLKVTIIPRTSGALGYAQYLPKEVHLRTEEQIMDTVCMALAGRAAEELFFGSVTTGASDDLRRVTDIVYSTIQLYGMNSRVGKLAFPKDPNAFFDDKPYSNATAVAMDEEARAIVDAAYQTTLELMREKKLEVEKVAHLLLDKETITHDDIIDLIGPRPFEGDKAYNEFVSRRQSDKEEKKEGAEEESISALGGGALEPAFCKE